MIGFTVISFFFLFIWTFLEKSRNNDAKKEKNENFLQKKLFFCEKNQKNFSKTIDYIDCMHYNSSVMGQNGG